jgi:hypothetical protein
MAILDGHIDHQAMPSIRAAESRQPQEAESIKIFYIAQLSKVKP